MNDKEGVYQIRFPPVPVRPGILGIACDCSHCGGSVKFVADAGQRPARSLCDSCDARHTLVQCGRCDVAFVMNEEQIRALMRTEFLTCVQPECGASLTHFPQAVAIGGFSAANQRAWSDDPREAAYVARAAERLANDPALLARFWSSHHCTGSRLKGAISKLAAIRATGPRSFSLSIADNEDGLKTDAPKNPVDNEIAYFDFVNNWRSALDMLSQELRVFFLSDVSEKDANVFKIPDLSPSVPATLRELHRQFVGPDKPMDITHSVRYLNALRNTMQHRFLAVTKVEDAFKVSNLVFNDGAPLDPYHSSTILVDDPRCDPGKETYDRGVEMLPTFDRILKDSQEFILRCYELAIVDEGPIPS